MADVALETALLTHGLPRPLNVRFARELEDIVRGAGARPRTVGVIDGRLLCGLDHEQIERLGSATEVRKVSLRDLPIAAARKESGGTTVAATLFAAARHGIPVLATGGIGGVHRSTGGPQFDISADLPALARHPVCTVCAGVKAILDLEATREMLETLGVTVIGLGTDRFPAFYSRSSDLPVDARVDSPEEAASVYVARRRLGLDGGILVVVPVPADEEVPREEIEPVISRAVEEAVTAGLHGHEVTPFLLRRVVEHGGAAALEANLALLRQNARVAAQISLAIDELTQPPPILT